MSKKLKKVRNRIIVSFLVFLLGILLPVSSLLSFLLFLTAYLIVGYDVVWKAFRNITNGQLFDESFLMTLATFGAFITGEYPEAVMVMWLYQVGELFQGYAVGKSRDSITALMEIAPEYANRIVGDEIEEVDPEDVKIDNLILVKAGERVPLDGIIVKGSSSLDTSALTGESKPSDVKEGDEVLSGCINLSGALTLKVLREYEDSTVAKILDLVENASNKKAKTENFITKFAKYYTPVVVILALALAIIPPLFNGEWMEYMKRACSFLVISCPCALVISVPMGFFGGIGAASKNGILVKGSNYLEALSKVKTMVFDKTGTLTKGSFVVKDVVTSDGVTKEELLKVAAIAESYSNHPIALSIKKAYGQEVDVHDITYQEVAGKGVVAKVGEDIILAGNHDLLKENEIDAPESEVLGTMVYIAKNHRYLGYIVCGDEIKEESKKAIEGLRQNGIKTVMLSGDREGIAKAVGDAIGIDEVYAQLLPQEKVEKLENLLEECKGVAFVGDGINDAPSLTRADVGIAMGGLGSDAAIEASDIVIMDDHLEKIDVAFHIAKGTLRIVWQNIVLALGVKFGVLILGALGDASMWQAVFADVGVAFIAIMNSMRALRLK